MKMRRKRELARSKRRQMSTSGGPSEPLSEDTRGVDDVLSCIQSIDVLDSDTWAAESSYDYLGLDDFIDGTLKTPQVLTTQRPKNKVSCVSTAIERQFEMRLCHNKRLMAQEEELHLLRMAHEQKTLVIMKEIHRIRIEQERVVLEKELIGLKIAKEKLKREKILAKEVEKQYKN